MSSKKFAPTEKGQALVETALILGLLLFIIFVMIEGARIFQANLTAQSAARKAGRYAITGDYDPSCLADTPPCPDPRVASIKRVAIDSLAGLRLDSGANYEDPNYYLVEVLHYEDESGSWVPDSAGGPGDPVMVRVQYRVGIITPMVNAIARTVRVSGQVVFNNELYNQYSNTSGDDEAPVIPALPTAGPSPTPVPPDLEVTKSDHPDPAIIREPLEYTLFVQNMGAVDATDVVLTDTLPANVTVTNPGPCTPSGSDLVCNLGTLPGMGSTSFTIEVEPQAAAIGVITNTATVGLAENDANPASNTDSVQTQVVDTPTAADLEVRKTASSDLVAVDDLLTYNVAVVNHGLAQASNVVMVDTLPDSVAYVGVTPSDAWETCTYTGSGLGGRVDCQLGALPRDTSATVAIQVRPQVEEEIINSVTVSADTPEPAQNNYANSASVAVTVENAANLGVTKQLSANAGVDERATYTVSVINNGPADATGVTVVDSLPPELLFVDFGTAADRNRCQHAGGAVTCAIGAVAEGAGDSVQIVVRPRVEGMVTNTATVAGDQRDPYPPNNTSSLTSEIKARSDLEVVDIVDTPDPVESGEDLTYQITVRNNGPSEAVNVRLEDTLPADTIFRTASASQGTCGEESGVVSCYLERLRVGDTMQITVEIIPTRSSDGTISTAATVSSTVVDPVPVNNTETETTRVEAYTFMTVAPICGPEGTAVTVRGYNWSANNNEWFTITWDPSGPDPSQPPLVRYRLPGKLNNRGLSWQETIVVPVGAGWRQSHTIRAETSNVAKEASFEVPCPAPDLKVLGAPQVITPTVVMAGDEVSFKVAVTNSGNLDAISQFFVGLYIDPDISSTTHISREYRVDLQAVSGLAVGAGRTLTFTIPAAFGNGGMHHVYAVVDSDPAPIGMITMELDETNNFSAQGRVLVSNSPNPTATPETTPTATATPTNPGGINGMVEAPAPGDNTFPQQGVRVTVFDDSNTEIASTYTNNSGQYFFTSLEPLPNPPGYRMTACIEIDGVSYADSVTGVAVNSGAYTLQNFLLEEGLPCGS